MNRQFFLGAIFGITCSTLIGGFLAERYIKLNQVILTDSFSRNQTITMGDQSNYLINEQLDELLKVFPEAARARVGIIHGNSKESTTDRIPLLRFDVINVRSTPGHDPGVTAADLPLSQWGDYLPQLIAGKCAKVLLSEMKEDAAIARFKILNASGFISCPITLNNGDLLGGIFLYWDNPILPPENTKNIEQVMKTAAAKIRSAIDVRVDSQHR